MLELEGLLAESSDPLMRMSCTYMFLSLLPEATTVEFHARVPTRDVCAVSSRILKGQNESEIKRNEMR